MLVNEDKWCGDFVQNIMFSHISTCGKYSMKIPVLGAPLPSLSAKLCCVEQDRYLSVLYHTHVSPSVCLAHWQVNTDCTLCHTCVSYIYIYIWIHGGGGGGRD